MGKRGPPPKPTPLKIADGNASKENLDDRVRREPRPGDAEILPPEWISGAALEKWHEMLPIVQAMKVMTSADVDALGRYCVLHEMYVKYLDQCRRGLDVLVLRDASGKVKYMQSTPAAVMFQKLGQQLDRLGQQFGLTPSSRTAINVDHGETADSVRAWLDETTLDAG